MAADDDVPAPAPPRPARQRVVTQLARPFFYTPSGEKVEVPLDTLGGAAATVDTSALDEDAPVPDADAMSGDVRPVYEAEGIRVEVSLASQPRVARSAKGEASSSRSDTSSSAGLGADVADADAVVAAPETADDGVDVDTSTSAPAPVAILSPPTESPPSPPIASVPADTASDAVEVPPRRMDPIRPDLPLPARAPASAPSVPERISDGRFDEDDDLDRAAAARVEIRSEEIDEILSTMPGGLLRWGTTAVFLTLAVLLVISWFIAYPDVVKGRVALTTGTPPVRLVARQAGEVARVFTEDGARATAGQPLVLLKNPAEYADVQSLAALLDRMEPMLRRDGPAPEVDAGRPLVLGTLQAPYSALMQAVADHRLANDEAFYAQRLGAARAQVADLERLIGQLGAQQPLVEQQLALAERTQARARELADRGLSSAAEVEQAEAALLARRLEVQNGRGAITNAQVQLNAQRAALVDLEQRRFDEGERGLVGLRGAHAALRAALSAWEQEHVLRAPVAGTVAYFRELRANQAVSAAEPLVAVVPDGGGLVGRVTLSGMGAGKVEAGQRAIIRLDGFPYREFGSLAGRVARVSQLGYQPDARTPEVTYLAEVELPRGLVTSYGRTLALRQEMTGEVDVVTAEMRLIERIFNKLRALRGTE